MSAVTTLRLSVNIEPPGNIIFFQLANATPPSFIESVRANPNWMLEPKIQFEAQCVQFWSCALQWLYKLKWDKNHKIDFLKTVRDFCKPHGILLKVTLDICEYCYRYDSKYGFENHLFWFRELAIELENLMFSLPDIGGKSAKVKEFRRFAKSLKNNENPFCSNEYPNLKLLGDSICRLATNQLHKSFYSEFLGRKNQDTDEMGFIMALQSFANFLHSDKRCVVTKADDHHILYKQGAGRGFKKIDRQTIKTWVRPERMSGGDSRG
jgi:hypothetical protein